MSFFDLVISVKGFFPFEKLGIVRISKRMRNFITMSKLLGITPKDLFKLTLEHKISAAIGIL